MAEDLKSLMDRIQKDACDKAETEAAAIVAKAKEKAAEIVAAAEAEARLGWKRPTRMPKLSPNAVNAPWSSPLVIFSSP